jgi:hypothetical protein
MVYVTVRAIIQHHPRSRCKFILHILYEWELTYAISDTARNPLKSCGTKSTNSVVINSHGYRALH